MPTQTGTPPHLLPHKLGPWLGLTQLFEGVGVQLGHLYTRVSYPGHAHSLPAVSVLCFADIAVFF